MRVVQALLALAVVAGSSLAQEPGKVTIESYTLANGLKVHLVEDHSSQVVAVDVWYDVGARNERPGRTGFAHLFEHMMFQGSANVKKAEHFQFVEKAGGFLNGSTTIDRTNYFEVLPSNRLNLGLWLEADRMRSLAITQGNLDNQREAVKEERRMRMDNQPYIGVVVDSIASLYDRDKCFAYAHSVVGSMADLNAAKVEDVSAFFKLYYAPNNASLVVAGDFVPAEAKKLIEQYFGEVPRVASPPKVSCDQPYNTGTMRRTVTDKNATLPAAVSFYRVPEEAHEDHPAIELLATILGQGESSRLNRTVVREAKAAAAAQTLGLYGPTRGPNALAVLAIANQGFKVDSVERLVAAQVQRIAADGVTDQELTKAKNAFRAGKIMERESALNVAESVHYAETFLGDPLKVNTDLARYGAVTVADIKRVAAKYLTPANSLVLLIVPPEAK
jgi:zinc protease